MTQNDDDFVEVEPAQPGRKRDHSRDAEILDATLEVLAEVGAARLTMDMVAARAGAGKATIYRRWTSKAELVIDAVAQMKRNQVDLERLPDTGTLRGDLLGLFKPQSAALARPGARGRSKHRGRPAVGRSTLRADAASGRARRDLGLRRHRHSCEEMNTLFDDMASLAPLC